jgi:hypothetical protein
MEKLTNARPSIQVKLSQNKKSWFVASDGRVLARPSSKQEAIDIGRALAKKLGKELLIYGIYGQLFGGGTSMSEAKENKLRTVIREVGKLPIPDPERVNSIVHSILSRHYQDSNMSLQHSAKNGHIRHKISSAIRQKD